MKIKQLTIKNFRGIKNAVIDFEDFTTLIGPNNIGKSTILHAIHLLLDNKKPKIEDFPGRQPLSELMVIECLFHKLESWEKNKPAISKLLHQDNLKIKMECSWSNIDSELDYAYYIYCTEEKFPWSEQTFTTAKSDAWTKDIFNQYGIIRADDYKDPIKMLTLENIVRSSHSDKVLSEEKWHEKKFANSLQQAVPHVMYVPATFKIEDELKVTATTSPFALLFNKKLFPHVKSDESYEEYINKANKLQEKIHAKGNSTPIEGLDNAMKQISETLNKVLDFDSKVKLSMSRIDIEPLFMKAATFIIEEEFETSLQYQGSGVQRALAFAILESNAEIEADVSGEQQRTVIVLYEEPELYIHPHLMKRLRKTLETRSESKQWQVISSTHSPFLIDIANKPESLKLIRRDANNSRVIHQIKNNIFQTDGEYDEKTMLRAALNFHPTVCESFFAKRVVIVEGDTELAVFSMVEELIEKLTISAPLIADTTIVSAGGKWTIPALIRILEELKIEYKVIHDIDRKNLTDEQLENEHQLHPFKANKKISDIAGSKVYAINDTFEHVLWDQANGEHVSPTNKPYNSWKRVRNYLDDRTNISLACQEKLKEVITFAFN